MPPSAWNNLHKGPCYTFLRPHSGHIDTCSIILSRYFSQNPGCRFYLLFSGKLPSPRSLHDGPSQDQAMSFSKRRTWSHTQHVYDQGGVFLSEFKHHHRYHHHIDWCLEGTSLGTRTMGWPLSQSKEISPSSSPLPRFLPTIIPPLLRDQVSLALQCNIVQGLSVGSCKVHVGPFLCSGCLTNSIGGIIGFWGIITSSVSGTFWLLTERHQITLECQFWRV